MAYIGGHVECIEKMMSYFDIVSVHEEEEYYDDIMESSQQQSQEEH